MLALLFSLVFGYSQAECDICGWPYTTGVNSQGKCYLLYQGNQGGLQSGCYTYCDAWARELQVQQSASPMLSFTDDASGVKCQCQRFDGYSNIQYKTRPTATCDFGYSDVLQAHYDSTAIALRNTRYDSAISNIIYSTSSVTSFFAQIRNVEKTLPLVGENACAGEAGRAYYYYRDYTTNEKVIIPLPAGASCLDLYTGALAGNSNFKDVYENQRAQDTSLDAIKMGIDNIQKKIVGNQSALLDALEQIKNKPVGGGTAVVNPTDLTPVLDAIVSARDQQLSSSNSLRDSLASLNNGFAGRMAFLGRKQDTTNQNLRSLDTSINGLGGNIDGVKGAVNSLHSIGDSVSSLKPLYKSLIDTIRNLHGISDSVSRLGRIGDSVSRLTSVINYSDSLRSLRRYNDSVKIDSAMKPILDSIFAVKGQSETMALITDMTSKAFEGENAAGNFITNLYRLQNLPGTCRDVPEMRIDLTSAHLGYLTIDLNRYSNYISISRLVFRLLGLGAAIMLVVKAMALLTISSSLKR